MLKQIHADLATLVLRQQLLDLAQGVRPSGLVAIKRLSRQELRRLASQLRRLDDALRVLRGAVSA